MCFKNSEQAESIDDLHVVSIAALTNVAAAYLKKPESFSKIKLFWLGGGAWPTDGKKYNAMNDVEALRILLASPIEFHWIIAAGVCSKLNASVSQSEAFVKGNGAIGEYLHQLLVDMNKGERAIYDIGPIAAIKKQSWFTVETAKAPSVRADGTYQFGGEGRSISEYTDIMYSQIVDDFFQLLGRQN
ncbi:nucleoside hydrolase [Brevibacillus sp. NRS-1366]|uniref:nucleoside hydrolase n=1 Tax=Brevibacillus sp. NRS-1366 TaxID=3233899 RepID=UPI003D245717